MVSRGVKIAAIATHTPEQTLTNEDLAKELGSWSAEKIRASTGVEQRGIVADGECASDLAYRAAQKLFEQTGQDRKAIDALLFCTQGPDYFLPATACLLQRRLELSLGSAALDFNQGSSGYVYGLWLASGLIESGRASRVLLLTGDTYSRFIHPRDRSVRMLFGDGAAATLLTPSSDDSGLGAFVLGTDGRGGQQLIVPAGGLRRPRSPETATAEEDLDGNMRSPENLYMNGREIFRFAITQVPRAFEDLLQKAKLSREDLDWVVLHQASATVIDQLVKRLKIPDERAPRGFARRGNTVSSSIPFVLGDLQEAGRLRSGAVLALLGYGVGYSWGGCILRWS